MPRQNLDLSRVELRGELSLDAPRGGRVTISGNAATPLRVNSSDYRSLRDLAKANRSLRPDMKLSDWAFERNPLGQDIHISVDNKMLATWPAGKSIRVVNPVRALRFLAGS